MTTAAGKKIEALKKTINLISCIAGNIQTEDLEEMDRLYRAISDAKCDLNELELEMQPECEDELAAVA